MKKPDPQKSSSKDESTGDSEKLRIKKLDHIAGVAKAAITTSGKFADWGKQASLTKAALGESEAKIRAAEQKTAQVAWEAKQKMDETARLRLKDADDHIREMAKLQMEHEQMVVINRERERVLDKMLEEPASLDQLAQNYRALIPASKH